MVDINNLGNNNSLFGFGNVENELEQEEALKVTFTWINGKRKKGKQLGRTQIEGLGEKLSNDEFKKFMKYISKTGCCRCTRAEKKKYNKEGERNEGYDIAVAFGRQHILAMEYLKQFHDYSDDDFIINLDSFKE